LPNLLGKKRKVEKNKQSRNMSKKKEDYVDKFIKEHTVVDREEKKEKGPKRLRP